MKHSPMLLSVGLALLAAAASPQAVAQPHLECAPPCRTGYVCHQGQCVSACNPPCSTGENCTAEGQCVAPPPPASVPAAPPPAGPGMQPGGPGMQPGGPPMGQAPQYPPQGPPPNAPASDEGFPYHRFRIGVGGGVGIAAVSEGSGYPFGFQAAIAVPLGARTYVRADLLVTYFTTSEDDAYDVGGGVSNPTYIDFERLLIAVRPAIGLRFSDLISARAGLLLGNLNLYAEHGQCGEGYQEDEWDSAAVGGSAALALHARRYEIAIVGDVYSAEARASCNSGVLEPTSDTPVQVLASGTFLF